MKKCGACKVSKEDNCFHKQKNGKKGLSWDCKECKKEYRKTDTYKNAPSTQKQNEYAIKFANSIKGKAYRNSEKYKQAQRQASKKYSSIEKNKERRRARCRERYNNDEEYREKVLSRNGNPNSKRLKLRFEIFKRDRFTCQYCGRKSPNVSLQIDHIYPRSKGGNNNEENLRTACSDCNNGKRDFLL